MTAIVTFKSQDTAFLAADTAILQPCGTICDFREKAIALHRVRAVIGFQGAMTALDLMSGPALNLPGYTRQLDMIAALPGALFSARQANRMQMFDRESAGLNELWLWLAMFCETEGRPRLMTMCTSRMEAMPELEPYQLVEHEGLFAPGIDNATVFPPSWRGSADQLTAKAMEAQRQEYSPFIPGAHIVGGKGVLWSISAQGIERETVIEWPEKLGDRCNPKLRGCPPLRIAV